MRDEKRSRSNKQERSYLDCVVTHRDTFLESEKINSEEVVPERFGQSLNQSPPSWSNTPNDINTKYCGAGVCVVVEIMGSGAGET